VTEAAAPRPEARVDLVDAALDAARPLAADLVAHGIGEQLDGVVAGDPVAVQVQQRMQLAQRQAAVTPQDGETRGPKGSAPEVPVLARQGMEGGSAAGGGASAAVALDTGPELVAELLDRREEGDSAGVQRAQLSVERVELDEERIAVDLAAETLGRAEVGGHAVGEEARAVDGRRPVGVRAHRRGSFGRRKDGGRRRQAMPAVCRRGVTPHVLCQSARNLRRFGAEWHSGPPRA